jgi:6-phosphogluconate dehydrogenase (decarboxylating)
MQPGVIGLGWMGGNRVVRLINVGHECVVYDTNTAVAQGIVGKGAQGGTALFRRLSSRGAEPSAHKLMSAVRRESGSHAEKPPARTGGAK